MKVDFTAAIRDLDGEQINENGKPITLGTLSINALLATLPDARAQPEQMDGTEKVRLATLAQAIHLTPKIIDLEAEQIALLKERIGRAYQPLAVKQAWDLLDPKDSE